MTVVTENYFYYPDGQDFSTNVVGVFTDEPTARKLVKARYGSNTALTLTEDSADGLWYKTHMNEQISIIFQEFELNELK